MVLRRSPCCCPFSILRPCYPLLSCVCTHGSLSVSTSVVQCQWTLSLYGGFPHQLAQPAMCNRQLLCDCCFIDSYYSWLFHYVLLCMHQPWWYLKLFWTSCLPAESYSFPFEFVTFIHACVYYFLCWLMLTVYDPKEIAPQWLMDVVTFVSNFFGGLKPSRKWGGISA